MKNKFAPVFVGSLLLGAFFTGTTSAAALTLVSAKISGANTATLVYSEPVTTGPGDYTAFTGALSGKTLLSVTGSGSNTVTLTFDGNSFPANASGGVTIRPSLAGATSATSFGTTTNGVQVADGQAPSLTMVNVFSLDASRPLTKNGNGATLVLYANEEINTPLVSVSGHAVPVTGSGSGPYTATYSFTTGDPVGVLGVNVVLSDLSGNSGNATFSVTSGSSSSVTTTTASSTTLPPPSTTASSSASGVSAPVVSEVTPIPYFVTTQTPNYVFRSSVPATLSYAGACSSKTTSAVAGNNTISFDPLANGFYNNCAIKVYNSAGSTVLHLSPFTVDSTWTPASEIDQTPPSTISSGGSFRFTKPLKFGSSGTEVLELQKRLKEEGFLTATPNGYFGYGTLAAVKAYQKAHGLNQLGTVGPGTRAALNQ